MCRWNIHAQLMRNPFTRVVLIAVASVVLLVFVAFMIWLFKPAKRLEVFILDKTVPTKERREHKSLHWVLNHHKYVDTNHDLYNLKEDYYGFFPINPEKEQFDFRSLSIRDVDDISDSVDLAYYADTYGVYYNDWYTKEGPVVSGQQKVYGGLNHNDYLLLKALKEKGKTIVTEFVLLDKSASGLVRKKTENLLHLRWQGWIGRYFPSLDTGACPGWIIKLHRSQNKGRWPYTGPGIVLVHKYGKVMVLDTKKHLNSPLPMIITGSELGERSKLPGRIEYPNWFDIVQTDSTSRVMANFHLPTSARGDSLLESHRLSPEFPAIIHHEGDYKFYYFAGDFSQNPVSTTTSYFAGIKAIDFLFYNPNNNNSSARFFWQYYIPLVEGIMKETHQESIASSANE